MITAAAALLVLWVSTGSACEAPDDKVDEHQLLTQQPILGPEIRRTIAHGSRRPGNRIKTQPGFTYEAAAGTPVVAVRGGRVRSAQNDRQYGNVIVLEHGTGMETRYAFLDAFDLRVGDCVAAGAMLPAEAGQRPSAELPSEGRGDSHKSNAQR